MYRGGAGPVVARRFVMTTCVSSALTRRLSEEPQVKGLLTESGGWPVGSAGSTTGRPIAEVPSNPRSAAGSGVMCRTGAPPLGARPSARALGEGTFRPVGRCDPGGARTLSRQRLWVDPQPAGHRSARRVPGPDPQYLVQLSGRCSRHSGTAMVAWLGPHRSGSLRTPQQRHRHRPHSRSPRLLRGVASAVVDDGSRNGCQWEVSSAGLSRQDRASISAVLGLASSRSALGTLGRLSSN